MPNWFSNTYQIHLFDYYPIIDTYLANQPHLHSVVLETCVNVNNFRFEIVWRATLSTRTRWTSSIVCWRWIRADASTPKPPSTTTSSSATRCRWIAVACSPTAVNTCSSTCRNRTTTDTTTSTPANNRRPVRTTDARPIRPAYIRDRRPNGAINTATPTSTTNKSFNRSGHRGPVICSKLRGIQICATRNVPPIATILSPRNL